MDYGKVLREVVLNNYFLKRASINEKVRVKVTSVDRFSFIGALNYFGSNLGLWPGSASTRYWRW